MRLPYTLGILQILKLQKKKNLSIPPPPHNIMPLTKKSNDIDILPPPPPPAVEDDEIIAPKPETEDKKIEERIKKAQERRKSEENKKLESHIKNDLKESLGHIEGHIKHIKKHEHILKKDSEKLIGLGKEKLFQIKRKLKSDREHKDILEDIGSKIKKHEKTVKKENLDLMPHLEKIKTRYEHYKGKGKGIRKAIIAKIKHAEKTSEE